MKYQKDDLAKFSEQIEYALSNYHNHNLSAANFDNIILSGLGGSGIAGRIAKSFLFDKSTLPIEVISDYELPSYASKRTLAIMSSYSGNTEETLAMYEAASKNGCTICVITTGGKLEEWAKRDQHIVYNALPGFQPRMALGYSLTYLIQFFGELYQMDVKDDLTNVAGKLKNSKSKRLSISAENTSSPT
jgi:glucose/mannose-6-phosphate isomerase